MLKPRAGFEPATFALPRQRIRLILLYLISYTAKPPRHQINYLTYEVIIVKLKIFLQLYYFKVLPDSPYFYSKQKKIRLNNLIIYYSKLVSKAPKTM